MEHTIDASEGGVIHLYNTVICSLMSNHCFLGWLFFMLLKRDPRKFVIRGNYLRPLYFMLRQEQVQRNMTIHANVLSMQ